MSVNREFASHGHMVRLAIEERANGWDVQEECDSALVHVEHYDDWHRVERAMRLREREVRRHGPAHIAHC
jgi:hypothetical protein